MDFSDLARLAGRHAEARIIQVAVSLRVFDILKQHSLDVAAIAAAIPADLRATHLLLDSLAAVGLLKKANDLFSLTEVSATYLVRSSPKFFGAMILFESSLWDCWRDLEKTIRSGRPARLPDMYQGEPQETERFIRAMDSLVQARGDAEALADMLDLSRVQDLLDVGSGPGTYPISLCHKFPSLRATIFDLPGTLKITKQFVRAAGLENRIRLLAGDYRSDPIPGRYQMIFLSNIIHGESSEQNARLMAKLYHCLERGGRIVIKDHILDDTLTHPPVGAIFAMVMLLTTEQGRCYSFSEVREWLEKAGFKRIAELPLLPPLTSSLITAHRD